MATRNRFKPLTIESRHAKVHGLPGDAPLKARAIGAAVEGMAVAPQYDTAKTGKKQTVKMICSGPGCENWTQRDEVAADQWMHLQGDSMDDDESFCSPECLAVWALAQCAS